MASSKVILVITSSSDGATTAGEIAPSTSVPGQSNTGGAGAWDTVHDIGAWIQAQAIGNGINIRYADTAVSASTTGTFTAATTNGQTMVINGVTFTARTSTTAANEFNIGSTATDSATNLVAAINASTTAAILNTVGASNIAGVVTFFAIVPGPIGKNIAISESLDNFTLADTTFSTGGTQAHSATISAGL